LTFGIDTSPATSSERDLYFEALHLIVSEGFSLQQVLPPHLARRLGPWTTLFDLGDDDLVPEIMNKYHAGELEAIRRGPVALRHAFLMLVGFWAVRNFDVISLKTARLCGVPLRLRVQLLDKKSAPRRATSSQSMGRGHVSTSEHKYDMQSPSPASAPRR
jgi:hypothetical protein